MSVYVREDQKRVIEDYSEATEERDDLPDLSQSQVWREMVDFWIDENPEVEELVKESTVVEYREQKYMEEEGGLINKRSGFETQVADNFERRFENGYRPEQLEEFAQNMRAKAWAYWPPDKGEDYSDRREQALAYVDAQVEHAKKASEVSDYDPLDPETFYSKYTGVEEGESRSRVEKTDSDEEIRESIEDRFYRADRKGNNLDEDALALAISNKHGISEDHASELIEEIAQEYGTPSARSNGHQPERGRANGGER
jgi:hypothetical protein